MELHVKSCRGLYRKICLLDAQHGSVKGGKKRKGGRTVDLLEAKPGKRMPNTGAHHSVWRRMRNMGKTPSADQGSGEEQTMSTLSPYFRGAVS